MRIASTSHRAVGRTAMLSVLAVLSISSDHRILPGVQAWTKPRPLAKKRSPSIGKNRRVSPFRNGSMSSPTTQLRGSSSATTSNDGGSWKEKFNAKNRQDFFQASKSGLAVSLAMVPEAGTLEEDSSCIGFSIDSLTSFSVHSGVCICCRSFTPSRTVDHCSVRIFCSCSGW